MIVRMCLMVVIRLVLCVLTLASKCQYNFILTYVDILGHSVNKSLSHDLIGLRGVAGTFGVVWGVAWRSATRTLNKGFGDVLLSPLMALDSFFMERLMLLLRASSTMRSTFSV